MRRSIRSKFTFSSIPPTPPPPRGIRTFENSRPEKKTKYGFNQSVMESDVYTKHCYGVKLVIKSAICAVNGM